MSAIISPPTKTADPPNMRRTSTGPNSTNSSRMDSASMSAPSKSGNRFCVRARETKATRLLSVGFDAPRIGRGELHRLAAAAGGGLVRIVEHEGGGQLVDLEVHLGPEQEQNGFWIDQQRHALVFDRLIELVGG